VRIELRCEGKTLDRFASVGFVTACKIVLALQHCVVGFQIPARRPIALQDVVTQQGVLS
jgi:hypothetical protein